MKLAEFDTPSATLDHVLSDKARRLGDKVFLTHLPDGRTYTYRQIDELSRRIGNGLLSIGIPYGGHVAVLMENCPEQILAQWAISRVGLVTVPINTAAKGNLLSYLLAHADCVGVIVEGELLDRIIEVAPALPKLRHVVVLRKPQDAVPACAGSTGEHASLRFSDFNDLLSAPDTKPERLPRFLDAALLMFTSGTTGPSKANIFSHAQFVYHGLDVATHHEYVPEDIAYVYLPLFHGNAFLGSTMGCFMADASIAVATRFSVSNFWADVRRSGATLFNCLSSVVNFLWNHPPSPDDRGHKVTRVHLAPVPKLAREFEDRFGVTIMSAYALTDFGMATSYNAKSPRSKLGSVGLPRLHVELKIFDDDDQEVGPGRAGEIVLRHKLPWCSTLGYYNDPEATLKSRRNLWFHTGDRGVIDADGYVWFTDRLKDAIRRRGENISAFEVEEAIRTHADIEDVAVYPVRAESSEDEVAVSVILKPSAKMTPEDLIRHCDRNLAYFMVPRYVDVVDSFPRTLNQKIEKQKLRQGAEERLHELWDRQREGIEVTRKGITVHR